MQRQEVSGAVMRGVPRNFVPGGGGQQIQLWAENGDLGEVAP
jgi:hypothetical protein